MNNCNDIFLFDDGQVFFPRLRKILSLKPSTRGANRILQLRQTTARVLFVILKAGYKEYVTDDHILYEVWDKHGLSSSSQALYRSVNMINKKFTELSGKKDWVCIKRVYRRGYRIEDVKRLSDCHFCSFFINDIDKKKNENGSLKTCHSASSSCPR